MHNRTRFNGFDVLEDYLSAKYDSTINQTNASLRIVDPEHLMVKGLYKQFDMFPTQLVKVVPDASKTNLVAQVITPSGTYPGVIESRYSGKVLYVAFPLENANSSTLLINMLDYLAPC